MALFEDNHVMFHRLKWLRVIFILIFIILLARLWHLTIIQSQRYQELAQRSHIRTIPLRAPRGLIYDRDGRILVDNVQSIDLVLFRDEARHLDRAIRFILQGVEINPEIIAQRLQIAKSYGSYRPVVLKEDLSLRETAYILSRRSEYPEVGIILQPRRMYRHGELAAHVLGYVGEVSAAQLEMPEFSENEPGDIIGQYGLERSYNRRLEGQTGSRRVLVNSLGKSVSLIKVTPPVEGQGLTLTLDLDLQAVADAELRDNPGAVVAIDPRNGEVLVMASRPAFDPNAFAKRISLGAWNRLLNDPNDPLQNRTIQSSFSPGSIFKVIMALAALEEGVITLDSTFYCPGGAYIYGHYFRCWLASGHGTVHLTEAIQNSCNVYFYRLGQRLGISQISEFSRKVGLGELTGIDLLGEIDGLVPSEEWKKQAVGQPWYAGETISVSIGQGPINVTPIQLARTIGAIATGFRQKLRLVRDPALNEANVPEARQVTSMGFKPEHLEAVRDGMRRVVEAGTGWRARVSGFEVCGKTGTAQVIGRAARANLTEAEQARFTANAWFVGFAPRDEPEIIVAVLVAGGGSGGGAAAPIGGKILERYYQKYKAADQDRLELAGSFLIEDLRFLIGQ